MQALRAVAVMLVVTFHFWPQLVPGGYAGVDVFFCISGFLITGHLLRDIGRGTFGFAQFYARRARRLLPASLLVLIVIMAAVLLLEPTLVWKETAQQVLASAGYVQNWVLAGQHVDYLNPEVAPTAVQHFWSLSVEEQFYLFWPLLLILGTATSLRFGRSSRTGSRSRGRRSRHSGGRSRYRGSQVAVTMVMAVLLAASLGYAIWATSHGAEGVYFSSIARVWQFAAGGLLAAAVLYAPAVLDQVPMAVRRLLSWAGFAAIGVSGFVLTASSGVPGQAALLPIGGTMAVLAAGHIQPGRPGLGWVRLAPVQWLGNVSYSLYLWHWPLIVLAPAVLARTATGRARTGRSARLPRSACWPSASCSPG